MKIASIRIALGIAVVSLFSTILCFAGEKDPPKIIYKKHTSVSFDDAIVEGTSNNPEGIYIVTPPEKQFGNLLRLRPNFHRELMRDALLLK